MEESEGERSNERKMENTFDRLEIKAKVYNYTQFAQNFLINIGTVVYNVANFCVNYFQLISV